MADLAGLLPSPHGNTALLANPEDLCTLSTCDLTLAQIRYIPSLGGNAFFIVAFSSLFALQAFFGIKYRTWPFLSIMLTGLFLQSIGYIGRIMMHNNPFRRDHFLLYLIPITIAPVFFSGALYICAFRIMNLFSDAKESRFRPRIYLIVFGTGSLLALSIKVIGGIVAATGSSVHTGLHVIQAGIFIQLFILSLFTIANIDFGFQILRRGYTLPEFTRKLPFKLFLITMVLSTLTLIIQTIYLAVKFSISTQPTGEVPFMLLESSLPLIACLSLTLFHPGRCLRGEPGLKTFKGVDGKRISASSFGSIVSMDVEQQAPKFPDNDNESVYSTNTATAVVAMVGRPRAVHIELSSIYGIPYECTRDDLPRPSI